MRESRVLCAWYLLCYTAAALGVTNAFPLSTFPMYSKAAPTAGARVVARDAAGEYHEVVRFVGWSCDRELDFSMVEKTTCPDGVVAQPSGYLAKDALDHVRGHAGSPGEGEPVDLIIRNWRLSDSDIQTFDCPVARCEARPK